MQRPAAAPLMSLDTEEVRFLAARLRRLFAHFEYELPDTAERDDEFIIRVAGVCIGDLLRKEKS